MIKKLFLPLCLLVATSTRALSPMLESILVQNESARERFEQLTTDEKVILDEVLATLNDFASEMRIEATIKAEQHKEAIVLLKDLLGIDPINPIILNVPFESPVVNFNAPEDDANFEN